MGRVAAVAGGVDHIHKDLNGQAEGPDHGVAQPDGPEAGDVFEKEGAVEKGVDLAGDGGHDGVNGLRGRFL